VRPTAPAEPGAPAEGPRRNVGEGEAPEQGQSGSPSEARKSDDLLSSPLCLFLLKNTPFDTVFKKLSGNFLKLLHLKKRFFLLNFSFLL